MFNRLRIAYYRWRLNLVLHELIDSSVEQAEAEAEGDAEYAAGIQEYISRLEHEQRYYTYQIARIPQPTA